MGSAQHDEWPSLDWEDQVWVLAASWGLSADRLDYGVHYQSSVPPLIADLTPVLPAPVQTSVEEATRALTRLDATLGQRVASFAPVLLRSEAAASSQIENLTASARSIFSAELGASSGQNAHQIAGNTRAMEAAIRLSADISASSIRMMHQVLMEDVPRHRPGQWREEAVWIGRRSDSPVGADFVAAHHSRVPELIDDLVSFAQRRDLPALVDVALTHAQFETIHPFSDGNGRTGRALAQAQLRARQVTTHVAVPVSAGLLADVDGYHDALTHYRQGNIVPIVESFAKASLRAVRNVQQLVEEIDEIRDSWNARLTVRRDSNAWRLLEVLTRRPVLNLSLIHI